MKNLLILIIFIFISVSCTITESTVPTSYKWNDVAVIDDLEVFVDTSSIKHENGLCYVSEKTIYPTENGKQAYIDKIKKASTLKGDKLEKKIKKWDNFSYTISSRIYDCTNKRSKTVSVTDYTIDDKVIISTKTSEQKSKWVNISADSMGDYIIYYVCDYGN